MGGRNFEELKAVTLCLIIIPEIGKYSVNDQIIQINWSFGSKLGKDKGGFCR
jgi:hypothetical protein